MEGLRAHARINPSASGSGKLDRQTELYLAILQLEICLISAS